MEGSAVALPSPFGVFLPLPSLHPAASGPIETELGRSWEGKELKGSEGSAHAEVESGSERSTPGRWPRQGHVEVENINTLDTWGTSFTPERHGLSFKHKTYKDLLHNRNLTTYCSKQTNQNTP